MLKQKITIWGRDLELNVVFDCYKGEEVTDIQKDALKNFLAHPELLNECKNKVEEYCKKSHPDIDFENIFRFVVPQAIFISRSNEHLIGIMCAYKFDLEHGLAIVFRNEVFDKIGTQDIII